MSERSVLITGCSSGFGLGLALAFHARGWKVFAALRDPVNAPPELADITVIPLDLENEHQVTATAANFKHLDCLINNAGYALNGPFASYTAGQMRQQMQVNVLGPALLAQELLPALRQAKGRIINLSSLAGETGIPMNSFYCASKHAIEGLSEALRHELAPHGIQVALVEPGGFRTRFAGNILWGSRALPTDSMETKQLAQYRAMQARMLARPGRDPALVVAAIVKLAERKTMPLRTRVGSDSRMMHRLRRWLPESLAQNMIGATFRRLMTKANHP